MRVSNPPPKPLLIWDGECHFCRRWIERWREITGSAVDYATSQESGERFQEIPREQFERSVIYIEADGAFYSGAEAVFRSLRCRSSKKWLAWSYDHVPGFAPVSESAYKIVSCNRRFASAITRLLWGNDVRPPTYFAARRWFLRAVGLIFLIAFVSLWVQIDGLIGANGIIPVREFLPAVHAQLGDHAWSISANAVLVRLERRLSAFPLWRRSRVVVASDFRNRAGAVIGRPRCFLSVTCDRRANVPQFSVGYSSPRDRFLVDLSRTVAALAETRN